VYQHPQKAMSANKRKHVVIETSILSADSQVHVHHEFETEADAKQYLADRRSKEDAKRAEWTAAVEQQLKANGGSDVLPLDNISKTWSRPDDDDDELAASLASLEPTWRDADLKLVHGLIETGAPPQGTDTKVLTKMARESAGDELKHMSKSAAEHMISSTTPIMWLIQRMQALHVHQELREKLSFQLGQQATLSNPERMWLRCVRFYNGFLKTLWEAHAFGRQVTKKPKTTKTTGPTTS
jgi:hypothetical protein